MTIAFNIQPDAAVPPSYLDVAEALVSGGKLIAAARSKSCLSTRVGRSSTRRSTPAATMPSRHPGEEDEDDVGR